jgi:hypothetical protein
MKRFWFAVGAGENVTDIFHGNISATANMTGSVKEKIETIGQTQAIANTMGTVSKKVETSSQTQAVANVTGTVSIQT